MRDNYEQFRSAAYPYIFRKSVKSGESGVMEIPLTSHGYITNVMVNFVAGENGTLRLRPYVELPGEINQELLKYAGEPYVSGDNVKYELPCYQEIENHAKLKLWYENTQTDPEAADSQIMVDIVCQYDSYLAPKNIIG